MSRSPHTNRPPDVRVGPFALWVYGYERVESEEYYDANWLRAAAHCGADGASVDVSGSILMTSDPGRFRDELERMHATLSGTASLDPLEPYLALKLTAVSHGHIEGEVSLTPDNATQSHVFRFQLGQSYLPTIAEQIRALLGDWPVRPTP